MIHMYTTRHRRYFFKYLWRSGRPSTEMIPLNRQLIPALDWKDEIGCFFPVPVGRGGDQTHVRRGCGTQSPGQSSCAICSCHQSTNHVWRAYTAPEIHLLPLRGPICSPEIAPSEITNNRLWESDIKMEETKRRNSKLPRTP